VENDVSDLRDIAMTSNAWPFVEARKVVARLDKAGGDKTPDKGYVLFQTGYGPSGLPHIGTFGEVARTTMLRKAFELLSDVPTKLFAFSDDMDGLRRVPDNIPNQELVTKYLELPLTRVPDPFECHDSFGAHNNAQLRIFLDTFGFEYEFLSATECYTSGRFDEVKMQILAHYDEIMDVILPTLGPERRATYSPFLPVCPWTNRVLQVPVIARDLEAGTITYKDADGQTYDVKVRGADCKMQWKVDWAMRWVALGADYEMSGKDLIESVKLSSRICRILGATPPEGMTYELFLDENGEKISKSRGNGLSVEDWLAYAPHESLAYYMYQSPKKAKRLHFDVIPKCVDEYLSHLGNYAGAEPDKQLTNPVHHIHAHEGAVPASEAGLSYNILLNLASVCNTEDKAVLWGFITRYAKGATPATAVMLDRLVGFAIRYYQDFVKPLKTYRKPDEMEIAALTDIRAELAKLPRDAVAEDIQYQVYEVGKRHPFKDLRAWFGVLYEILLGQAQGPRMGSFIALYGIDNMIKLIDRALAGDDLAKPAAS
jgi:lysyl-tRNA synthetase class 1